MIFKYFRRNIQQKIRRFLTRNKAKLCKILNITLVHEKNAIFFAENGRKSQKIVIITSTPEMKSHVCKLRKACLHEQWNCVAQHQATQTRKKSYRCSATLRDTILLLCVNTPSTMKWRKCLHKKSRFGGKLNWKKWKKPYFGVIEWSIICYLSA
jgi:hypothetical protein